MTSHEAACRYAVSGSKKAEKVFREAMAADVAAGRDITEYARRWFAKLPTNR